MIITERFVLLNFPKTGSSFVRKTIKRLYSKYESTPYKMLMKFGLVENRTLLELFVPAPDSKRMSGKRTQHGTYRQIPSEHLHKKIVSIVRNPFDRYVSAYLYRWWVRYPLAPIEQLREFWPHFPELNFAEYYDMMHRFGSPDRMRTIPQIDLGHNSIQFIQFYFRDPDATLAQISDGYLSEKQYVHEMPEMTFLHQECLSQELYAFLLGLGFPRGEITFIQNAERVNVTPRSSDQKETGKFYTPELIELIHERDRLLFDLFPEYRFSLSQNGS